MSVEKVRQLIKGIKKGNSGRKDNAAQIERWTCTTEVNLKWQYNKMKIECMNDTII